MTQDTQMIPVLQEHFPLINIFLKIFLYDKTSALKHFYTDSGNCFGRQWLKMTQILDKDL